MAVQPPTGNLPGTTVTALIGGQTATVTYAGRSAYAGVDQINVTIPSGVSGCFVSVQRPPVKKAYRIPRT